MSTQRQLFFAVFISTQFATVIHIGGPLLILFLIIVHCSYIMS